MLVEPDEDREEIRGTVRKALSAFPVGGGIDEGDDLRGAALASWEVLATDLGVGALAVPESRGGLGLGMSALAVVLEETGRALSPAPVLSTCAMATSALLSSTADEVVRPRLEAVMAGTVATIAFVEGDDDWFAAPRAVRATQDSTGWVLDGVKPFVLDAELASFFVVSAATDDGPGVFVVDADQPAVAVERMRTMDLSRGQARVVLTAARATRLDRQGDAEALLGVVRDTAMVALAAEQLGAAERALEMAVDYVKERHQFGRPIGSFQAVKHRCADMLVSVEKARSIVQHAVWALETGDPGLPRVASAAKAVCSQALVHVAFETVQVHGGIGFTWEHDAHRYVRRAKTTEVYLGTPAVHLERIAAHLASA